MYTISTNTYFTVWDIFLDVFFLNLLLLSYIIDTYYTNSFWRCEKTCTLNNIYTHIILKQPKYVLRLFLKLLYRRLSCLHVFFLN